LIRATELHAALAGRYEVLDELGSGGMATVFRAKDPRHERTVAIKVLHPGLAASVGAERFLAEIKTTAKLTHPHILPLHDSGVAEGFFYYVMPLVEGESLRQRLERESKLSVEEAVRITLQIADALRYAHGQQVIHRDIKPENILMHRGHAMVADFGIARVVSAAGDQRITVTGMAIGTPAYMSPEQAAGELDLDGRSDLYALACVLYEMLSGELPFTGPTISAILAQRFMKPAPRITIKRPEVPRPVEAAISMAMALQREDRFESVDGFAQALVSKTAVPHDTSGRSIAVLAFANMSDDPETEYFSDGISEEIINVLAQLPGLRVAARTSAFSFKGKNVDLRSIGDQLSVATVLEGSVRKAGNRLRITAQLINVSDGYHLWSERYDRELTDVFAIQDEIAAAIAEKLKVTFLAAQDGQAAAPPTRSIEAYELFLKARGLVHRRGPGIRQAVELYEEALALDPDFGAAYAALTHALILAGFYGLFTAEQARARAIASARRAVEQAPELSQTHGAAALVALLAEYDRAKADAAWSRALELNPGDAAIRMERAYYSLCNVHGDFERALSDARLAVEHDPLSALAQANLGLILGCARRYPEALAQARKTLEIDRSSFLGHFLHGLSLMWTGNPEGALAAATPVLAVSGRHPWMLMVTALAHHRAGRTAAALAMYQELVARAASEYVQPSLTVLVANGLGLADEAARLLRECGEHRDIGMPVILLHFPEAEGLADTPAGHALLRLMGWDDLIRSPA
jgi:serine/threonine protein kinase/tetratricopeptide (TPR) repeat protein